MANPEHLKILRRGVRDWNLWRKECLKVQKVSNISSDLNPADLEYGNVVNLTSANLRDVTLCGANLRGVRLSGADLSNADLDQADLRGADLQGAILSSAHLSSAKLNKANLSDANLSHSRLGRQDWDFPKLGGADLSGADLSGAMLAWATLDGVKLNEANLISADLTNADLSEADVSDADLRQAKLGGANLTNANFSRAKLGNTILVGVDLSSVQNLVTVEHFSPSTIGIDTLFMSQGKIPQEFLLGCGVPESLVTFIPAITSAVEPFQFYSCFISYSTNDEEFARRLHSRLRDEKVPVWFAPEDIKGGEKLYDQLERAIQVHDRLLLVLSEHSIKSNWVETEIHKAIETGKRENRQKLFPIRLTDYDTLRNWRCFDADSGRDMAREVREFFIPDFSNWKDHDSFEKAFARLVRDLKAQAVNNERTA